MDKLKAHPYDYITPENYDTIKNIIEMGMTMGKSPMEIADLISQTTGLDMKITTALIQAELKDTLKEMSGKKRRWKFW